MQDTIFKTPVIEKSYKEIFYKPKFDHKILQNKGVDEKTSFKKAS